MTHDYNDLITLFNRTFYAQYNTKLVKGGDEPIYLPADENRTFNGIYFAHGYFSSALHEIAHWLVAGRKRWGLVDFGYWYEADGRSEAQQRLFEQVEVKPQALEWILSVAAKHRFYASSDNLNGTTGDTRPFKQAVYNQVCYYAQHGLPKRAAMLHQALCEFYGTENRINLALFDIDKI
ncbi:elongation factor P hydroxylase [Spirabiliibacterium falconis]|uniref:elongation factor P hydroxylase n=1 Tax=Spirabiliibacterium falconis TaxID=572023 RepID=UPI001AAD9780|nr:elongation factor P hydroxylase [Spirabiliibacterium falconis]MBE2894242.1 elongation factor P hydroxylase [Spirabiliibacterium falconis]